VTLLNRLRQAEDWLRQLCQQLWKDNGVNLEPALKERPVRLVDGTVVKEPGKTGGQWRIHYSIRLPSLECDHFDLTPVKGKNTGEKLGRFTFRAGELVLADAGYRHRGGSRTGRGYMRAPESSIVAVASGAGTSFSTSQEDQDVAASRRDGGMAGLGTVGRAKDSGAPVRDPQK
jgi:hypothetical protein